MVGSKGKAKATVSKSNSINLAVACANPDSLKRGIEKSADNPLNGEEENNQILTEGSNSTGKEMRDAVICEPVVGNGCEEEQLAKQTDGEAKEPANEINFDRAEAVPLCGQTVVVSEVVRVGENEERINVVAPEEDKEQIQDGDSNNSIEGGEKQNSSKAAVRGNMNIDEGLCSSEHGIVEESSTDNMQGEEAITPTNNEKTERTDEDANIANDVNSFPKVVRPKRKMLKKKAVKKKIAVHGEAKSQSLIGNETSGKPNKADTDAAVKNDEKALPEDQSEAGEERKVSKLDVEGNMNIDEGLCASEHGVTEERLLDNLQSEEANKINAEESMSSAPDDVKIECIGEDASIVKEAISVPKKILGPKRKVLKKKVVKNKMVVQKDVVSMEENMLGAVIEGEASGEMDKEDTKADVKNEEKTVSGDHGKIELTEEDANTSGNVEVDPGKANGPKRKILKKKVVAKVVQGNVLAPENEAKPEGPINLEASGEANKVDATKDAKNDEKVEIKPAVGAKRKILRKKVQKGQTSVAATNESMPEGSIDHNASGEANKADTNKDVKNDEKAEIKPEVRAKRKRFRKKKLQKGQTNVATAGGEQKSKVIINDEAGNKKDDETGEAVASGVGVNRNKKNKMKMVKEDNQTIGVDGINKPGSSEKRKDSGRFDSMGMIFMCSSETKKDCYRYNVLGLPAGKKDTVLKIYKGMKLFLFDINKRLMYGIYEAAAPGGYNIEPRAFKRQFPSQVRFTVERDCLPLAEEKFKTAINDNYYAKNKFKCQLTDEQVKNLSKLFTETNESKPAAKNPKAAPSSSTVRDRKRKRPEGTRKSGTNDRRAEDARKSIRNDKRRRSGPTDSRISSAELERNRLRHPHEVRHPAPIVIDDRYHHRPVYDYEREPYRAPALPTTVYQHLPSQYSYDYERPDIYRSESSWELERRQVAIPRSSREYERPIVNVDIPYAPYSETRAYREPQYETTLVRREPEYESTSLSVRPTEYFRVSDTYSAPGLPPYRRY